VNRTFFLPSRKFFAPLWKILPASVGNGKIFPVENEGETVVSTIRATLEQPPLVGVPWWRGRMDRNGRESTPARLQSVAELHYLDCQPKTDFEGRWRCTAKSRSGTTDTEPTSYVNSQLCPVKGGSLDNTYLLVSFHFAGPRTNGTKGMDLYATCSTRSASRRREITP
jgi:hypothetical protein